MIETWSTLKTNKDDTDFRSLIIKNPFKKRFKSLQKAEV